MGVHEFGGFIKRGVYETVDVNIDLRNVLNVGGGGVILELSNGNVLKVEKININDAQKWNKNREGKWLNGYSGGDYTELHFGEELLLNGFELGGVEKIIDVLIAKGKHDLVSKILEPLSCHLLKIDDEWFITNGK